MPQSPTMIIPRMKPKHMIRTIFPSAVNGQPSDLLQGWGATYAKKWPKAEHQRMHQATENQPKKLTITKKTINQSCGKDVQ